MRPIDRGINQTVFNNYREAFEPLKEKIGGYCSYCERRLETHLAIEHVQPKVNKPELELEWSNFLLACTNCNSNKKDVSIDLGDYVWPDQDNTLYAFGYDGALVRVALATTHPAYDKADALLKLAGLDKHPGNSDVQRRPKNTDNRWKSRFDVLNEVMLLKRAFDQSPNDAMRTAIVSAAKGHGFFSMWYEAFRDDQEIRNRLISQFPGTAATAFDQNGRLASLGCVMID